MEDIPESVSLESLDPASVIVSWSVGGSGVGAGAMPARGASARSSAPAAHDDVASPTFVDLRAAHSRQARGQQPASSSSSSPAPFALPAEMIQRGGLKVSGNEYDADAVDEAFVAAVCAGRVATRAQVASWWARAAAAEAAGEAPPPGAAPASPLRGKQAPARPPPADAPALAAASAHGGALVDLAGLELAFEVLERESFIESSRVVLLDRVAESDRALAAAKAGVLTALNSYKGVRASGLGAGHGAGEGPAGPAAAKKKVAQEAAQAPGPSARRGAEADKALSATSRKRALPSDGADDSKSAPTAATKKGALAQTAQPHSSATALSSAALRAAESSECFNVPLDRGRELLKLVSEQLLQPTSSASIPAPSSSSSSFSSSSSSSSSAASSSSSSSSATSSA